MSYPYCTIRTVAKPARYYKVVNGKPTLERCLKSNATCVRTDDAPAIMRALCAYPATGVPLVTEPARA